MQSLIFTLAIFLPLLSFIIVGGFSRYLSDIWAHRLSCSFMIIATVAALYMFDAVILNQQIIVIKLMSWIEVDILKIPWCLFFDSLTAIMVGMICIVSCLVHIYSVDYMAHDTSVPRFMAYLSLFTFMMLILVTSANMLQLFFGWEGVGLVSYLLIGFWYQKDSANAAAMKAFIINRIGDLGLVLGMGGLFYLFDSLEFYFFLPHVTDVSNLYFTIGPFQIPVLEGVALLLFFGAMGKSAQLGLHTWLADAMEGPTPVSALIHAATMVTAGVFLLARLSPLYEQTIIAKQVITILGATTALFAGTIALTQFDIKKIIAYSTCSQLGYMFIAVGLGFYNFAIFHLITHAFFKALLFLGAGSVIHAMSGEQDIRHMGGIFRFIPITYSFMWIGTLALTGIPFFAGYYSKDAILEAAWSTLSISANYAYGFGILTVILTAFYSGRLLILTFHGSPRADEKVMSHIHEPGWFMQVSLAILAVGAMVMGSLGIKVVEQPSFWQNALFFKSLSENKIIMPSIIHSLPFLSALLGFIVAVYLYIIRPNLPQKIAEKYQGIYQLFYNKWYFDEVYNVAFIQPTKWLGYLLWQKSDQKIIDNYGPNGIAALVLKISKYASRLQSGYIYHYALVFLLGFLGLLIWICN